jgi:arylsulfatase
MRWLLALLLLLLVPSQAMAREAAKRPNFLIIVADDLGFSDLGAFGGEIDTPNLDALALAGMRLTGFHTAPACSPTRAMLLTGSDSHRVGLGAMSELTQVNQQGRPGFEGYLRADTATLAERLSAAGYRTLYSGKWHLGVKPEQDPYARGFHHSFALLHGGHNHFGTGMSPDPEQPSGYREDGVAVTSLPADFYSTDFFADRLIGQLKRSKAGRDGHMPFFAYLAFTAPHFPLQAPPEAIAKYRTRYDAGYEVLRERRLKRQRELGLVDASVVPHRLVDTPRWDALSDEERRVSARNMEIYAEMVDRLDQAVGRVIATLRETGELDNTVILFLSDNGAEGQQVLDTPIEALRQIARASLGDIEGMGSARTYLSYGNGWAQAATAPSWRQKAYATEGGTRSVAFIWGPVVRKPGAIARAYMHVTDVVPTFLDIAGVPLEPGRFDGRAVQPIDGLSWSAFLKRGAAIYPAERAVGNELFGSRSLRRGDWKLTDISDGRWRLFDIAADPGETRDLSQEEPARKAALLKAWEDYAKSVGVVLPDPPMHSNPPQESE